MKYFFLHLSLALCLGISSHAQTVADPGYVPGEIMVMLNPKASVDQFCADLETQTGTVFNPKQKLSQSLNLWLISFDPVSIETMQAEFLARRHSHALITQVNHTHLSMRGFPDDEFFNKQWALHNDGTNASEGLADINAPEAWDIATGGVTYDGDTIVVAVIDGGFDLAHEDLVENWFINRSEIPGNFADDDGNGLTDDVCGWNFYTNEPDPPLDSHGTHVAGTVGARGNNGTGVTGINWNVKILPVSGSSSIESTVVASYGYVLDMRRLYNQTAGQKGAYIVASNSSFGVDQAQPSEYPLWCAMYDSMGYEGILSVAATVNNNLNVDEVGDIPTACPSDFLITVTNTTAADLINTSAGYGEMTIDIGAPGTKIYSTTGNNNYGNNWGTSMATPHVSGTIGLMYSAACGRVLEKHKHYPAKLALLMKRRLLNKGVDKVLALDGLVATGGRLNLFKAVKSVSDSCLRVVISGTPSSCGACNGSMQAVVEGETNPVSFIWSNAPTTSPMQEGLCPGTYFVTVVDALGDTAVAYYALSDVGGPEVDVDMQEPTCPGFNNGVIDISGGFNYQWSDGSTGANRSGVGAGVYFLSATNETGTCTTVVAIVVTEPDEMAATYDYVLPEPLDGSNGTLTVSAFGGTPPYTYYWSTGDETAKITGLSTGKYFLTITDAHGCVFTDLALLGFPLQVPEESVNREIKLYPNPANEEITIRSGNNILDVVLWDLQGRVVFSESQPASPEKRIHVGFLNSGFYVAEVRAENGIYRQSFQIIHER